MCEAPREINGDLCHPAKDTCLTQKKCVDDAECDCNYDSLPASKKIRLIKNCFGAQNYFCHLMHYKYFEKLWNQKLHVVTREVAKHHWLLVTFVWHWLVITVDVFRNSVVQHGHLMRSSTPGFTSDLHPTHWNVALKSFIPTIVDSMDDIRLPWLLRDRTNNHFFIKPVESHLKTSCKSNRIVEMGQHHIFYAQNISFLKWWMIGPFPP